MNAFNEKIKNYLQSNGFYDGIANFQVYTEGMAIYHVEKEGSVFLEITIIADDDFFRTACVIDLLTLKRMSYFSCSIYLKETDEISNELISDCTWNIKDIIQQN